DTGKIPNFSNLGPTFQNPAYDPGDDVHAIPWLWGTNGIGWSEEVLGADATVDSWDAMWNEEWSGNITMLDNMRAVIGAALQRLGYSLNSTDESEVEEAKESLIQQKPLLKTYTSTVFDILANGTASPCYGWSGDVLRGRFETMEDGESPVHYVIPKEGSSIWTDNGAIPKDAANINAGYAFLVYFLTPEVNAKLSNFARYGTPNDAAQEFVEPRIREATSFPEEVMNRLEYYEGLGEGIKVWQQAWDEVQEA
ncbi:MAG: spermidine/putrescine ABC transporter substrate-binding protein, partial [Halobacteriales archaeon]|nr:spermidine/putrescine ABC transporter substrate-binding protein [Halobacteriales archaeon]